MKRFIFSITTALLLRSITYGQGQSSPLPTVSVSSPEAAALEKYVRTPVNAYTGVPAIELPLYTIRVRDLTIPISLSYHAGGFRVAEEASWVGLGWTLSAGGSITRTIRGVDDFAGWLNSTNPAMIDPSCYRDISPGDTYLDSPNNAFCSGDSYRGAFAYQSLRQHSAGSGHGIGTTMMVGGKMTDFMDWDQLSLDWEPDNFSYRFLNNSGQFVYGNTGALTFIQKQKIKFTYTLTNTNPSVIWKAVTADGFQYFFEAAATSQTENSGPYTGGLSEWYLTKICSPQGEVATFIYEAGEDILSQPSYTKFETKVRTGAPSGEPDYAGLGMTHFQPKYLTKIIFSTGYVSFERNSELRQDLQGGQSLKQISVFTTENKLIKRFNLATSYFTSPSSDAPNKYSYLANTYEDKRLRLDKVVEISATGQAKPPTAFTYNTTSLPVKTSYDVDYWGYYNGPRFNTTMIPTYAGTAPGVNEIYQVFKGANREPDASAMQACILQKVTYPTGGNTTYTFEPHEYGNLSRQELYVSAGTQAISVYRDDTNPYYNTPPQTFTLANQNPEAGNTVLVRVNVLFTYNRPNGGYYSSDEKARTTITLTGPNGYSRSWGFNDSQPYTGNGTTQQVDESVWLDPGTYTLTASTPGNKLQYPEQISLRGDLTWQMYQRRYSKIGGGLRVTKVEDWDGLNSARNQVRTYSYSSPQVVNGQNVTVSDGILMTHPCFNRTVTIWTFGSIYSENLFQLCSFSNANLSTGAQGSLVGYSKVTTYTDAAKQAGKVEQYYYNLAEQEPAYYQRMSSVPTLANILNGHLLSENTYASENGAYRLLKSVSNSYDTVNTKNVRAIARGKVHSNTFNNQPIPYQEMYFYPIATGWVRLASTSTSLYSPQGAFTEATAYYYDANNVGHMQVSRTETTRSDGSKLIGITTYPADYPAVTSGPLAAMRSDAVYQHSAVVESRTQLVTPAGQSRTVGGRYLEYDVLPITGRYVPVAQHALELTQPTSNLTIPGPNLPASGVYTRKQTLRYDGTTGNLQQAQVEKGSPVTYLWGYNNTLPIAEVKNAVASEIQHDNFESQQGWQGDDVRYDASMSHTGHVSATLLPNYQSAMLHSFAANSLTITLAASKRYLFSGWVYTTGPTAQIWLFQNQPGFTNYYADPSPAYATTDQVGKWVYLQQVVTVPAGTTVLTPRLTGWRRDINSSGQVWFDDLRLHPLDAQMTTYTYEPLIGMTSVSDVNNRPTYYEYDGLGRLLRVKDEQGRLRARQEYHYAGQ